MRHWDLTIIRPKNQRTAPFSFWPLPPGWAIIVKSPGARPGLALAGPAKPVWPYFDLLLPKGAT